MSIDQSIILKVLFKAILSGFTIYSKILNIILKDLILLTYLLDCVLFWYDALYSLQYVFVAILVTRAKALYLYTDEPRDICNMY